MQSNRPVALNFSIKVKIGSVELCEGESPLERNQEEKPLAELESQNQTQQLQIDAHKVTFSEKIKLMMSAALSS